MNGDKCVKPNCGCATKMSSTIYWCENCNVPIYEKFCPSSQMETIAEAAMVHGIDPDDLVNDINDFIEHDATA